jgi:hypothetical protein
VSLAARQVLDLHDLGFGNLKWVDPRQANPRVVDLEHDLHRLVFGFAKDPRQDINHKIHGGVVVVQQQNLPLLGRGGLGAGFGLRLTHGLILPLEYQA